MLADRAPPADFNERLRALVERWARDQEIAAAYLFGSRGRGETHARSDVDIAVVLAESLEPERRRVKRLELVDRACRGLGTDAVDVIVLEDVPSILGQRALKSGRLLLASDERRRVAVVEQVLRAYFDEAPLRAELDRALGARIREGCFGR